MVMQDVMPCNWADKYLAVQQLQGVMSQKRIIYIQIYFVNCQMWGEYYLAK